MATGELRYSERPGMNAPATLTPALGSTTRLTMCTMRNASTKTQRWSCHGKIRFERFHVERFVGWLRTSPSTICPVSSRKATMPVARAASQNRSSACRSVEAGRIWSVA